MPISEIPIFSMLRTKMQWHQERQRVLAENVSNADTPNFRPRDLAPLKFDGRTPGAECRRRGRRVPAAGTIRAGAQWRWRAGSLARTDRAISAGRRRAQFHPDRKGISRSGRPATP